MSDPQEGDNVRVKIRSEPGSERAVHKFEGKITKIDGAGERIGMAKKYHVDIQVGIMNVLTIRENTAEFEVLE